MTFKKGYIPWNKGLTKETDERIRKYSERLKGRQSYLHNRSYIDVFGESKAQEIRKKQSKAHMGKKPWNEGLPCSEETKRKLSEALKGRVAWNKGKHLSLKHRHKLSENHKGMLGKRHSMETRGKMSGAQKGEKGYWFGKYGKNHPNWCGGISFEPYGVEFDKELKTHVRARDNYKCCECGHSEEQLGYTLTIHHVDYDKKNNEQNNLISLCRSCHAQTNFKREDWTEYYQDKMRGV